MATPETRCQVVEADARELSAYSFDSDDKTLAGIGSSDAVDASTVRRFDSSDQTLVGIGPSEREKHAKLAELVSDSPQAEATPESVPLPHSESPGPFVASDDDDDAPLGLPTRQGEPWGLALSAVLLATAAVALLRGGVPHTTAPRQHSATSTAPLPLADAARMPPVQFETAATPSAESSAVETAITPPASAPRDKPLEVPPRAAASKAVGSELLGALDVTSNSPAGLVLDGRPLGKAPRVIQLPAGPHTVLFVHPQRGRMSVTVNVRAGRTTTASANF